MGRMAEEMMSQPTSDVQSRKIASQYQIGIGSRSKRKRGRSRRGRKEIAGEEEAGTAGRRRRKGKRRGENDVYGSADEKDQG